MNLLISIASLVIRLVLLCLEATLWLLHGLRIVIIFVLDLRSHRRATKGGIFRCPDGHPIPLSGSYTVECGDCGFRYKASGRAGMLICANVECGAGTVFVHCPDCGLSRRVPYRYGRRRQ